MDTQIYNIGIRRFQKSISGDVIPILHLFYLRESKKTNRTSYDESQSRCFKAISSFFINRSSSEEIVLLFREV